MIFEEFKELIKREEYFKAHEILEEYWQNIRKTSNPEKNVYRGFINAAVAMELKKRGRNNYMKVWQNYEKYKFLYEKNKRYLEIMYFLDSRKP